MADGIRVEIRGAEQARRRIAEAEARAAQPKPMFEEIGLALVNSTRRRFELGRTPDGNPWPPSIRVLLGGGKTLIDSGRMMLSLTYEASDRHVAVGSNAIYAAIHQFGGTIKPVNGKVLHFTIGGRDIFARKVEIPARPFLGLDEADEKEIELIAGDFILAEEARDAR